MCTAAATSVAPSPAQADSTPPAPPDEHPLCTATAPEESLVVLLEHRTAVPEEQTPVSAEEIKILPLEAI
jgi:hypothetical protein